MIEIQTHYEPNLPKVSIDATQVHQVIMNLATNAAHSMMERGGLLEVKMESVMVDEELAEKSVDLQPGPYVRLSLRDTGCGMDKALLERIFEPFFTTKPQGQGTGLGLSIVHGVMRTHGGAVTVYSELGKGTKFHLYFPADPSGSSLVEILPEKTSLGQGQHLMYVEDEETLGLLAKRMLERRGYSVTIFNDPLQALAAFRESPASFDGMITDLSMPHLTGLALARSILELRPDLPIILVSGFINAEDVSAAQKLGIVHMLQKPYTVADMGAALESIFHPTSESQLELT